MFSHSERPEEARSLLCSNLPGEQNVERTQSFSPAKTTWGPGLQQVPKPCPHPAPGGTLGPICGLGPFGSVLPHP
jgi:hypothetical protein